MIQSYFPDCSVWDLPQGLAPTYFEDDVHLNNDGYRILYNAILKAYGVYRDIYLEARETEVLMRHDDVRNIA